MSDTTDVLPESARESAAPAPLPVSQPAALAPTAPAAPVLVEDGAGQVPADDATPGSATPRRRRSGTGLQAMLLPELQSMASSLGIQGTGRLRKGQLIAAIQNVQNGLAPMANGAGAEPEEQAAEPAAPRARSRRVTRGIVSPEQAELVEAPARETTEPPAADQPVAGAPPDPPPTTPAPPARPPRGRPPPP
ncbi:Rho termination factor N-terminal domain-containing protein, partial [Frankia sp. AgW1.1]|uniref:Rho termination factor N-terminal domain-containing protein n=1 Tax=Frankia sp. AgW1.1 TaxID=1836971 RepID=UPI001EE3B945